MYKYTAETWKSFSTKSKTWKGGNENDHIRRLYNVSNDLSSPKKRMLPEAKSNTKTYSTTQSFLSPHPENLPLSRNSHNAHHSRSFPVTLCRVPALSLLSSPDHL